MTPDLTLLALPEGKAIAAVAVAMDRARLTQPPAVFAETCALVAARMSDPELSVQMNAVIAVRHCEGAGR